MFSLLGMTAVNTVCQDCEMGTVALIRKKLSQRLLGEDKGLCPLIVRSFGGLVNQSHKGADRCVRHMDLLLCGFDKCYD